MGEEGSGAPGVPVFELPEWVKNAATLLRHTFSLSYDHLALMIGVGLVCLWGGYKLGGWNAEQNEKTAVSKEREPLVKELNDERQKSLAAQTEIADLKVRVTDRDQLQKQVAALTKEREDDKKALEETSLRDAPELQMSQADFLRKVESAKDGPAQEQFRKDCSNKTVLGWKGTFAGIVEAPATSKNRAIKIDFDNGAYSANCYLSSPELVAGFAQTAIGTPVTITKGTIEKVNFGYTQMARCQVVR